MEQKEMADRTDTLLSTHVDRDRLIFIEAVRLHPDSDTKL